MFIDPTKVPRDWIRNARLKPGVVPAGTKLGPPVQVSKAYPLERLVAEGYVGLYTKPRKMETIDDVIEMAKSFDALDLFGEGND